MLFFQMRQLQVLLLYPEARISVGPSCAKAILIICAFAGLASKLATGLAMDSI